ncbi:MAG TPA: hypothetical protein PKH61_04725 [Microbacteriaceae bacterium]|jgi:hypothetical protein|nr:hypothetical protein [Microbacteriaceae bacterium]HQC93987.1 hypothetical protein [Microbacteriaceae bacterium]
MSERHDAGRAPATAWIWVGVLALTSSFQFGRGAPIDGSVFAAFAVLLVAENLGMLPDVRPVRAPSRPVLAVLALGCAIVLIMTPFAGPATRVVLALIGLASVAWFWPQAHAPRRAGERAVRASQAAEERAVRRRTATLWAILAVLVCLWELAAFFLGHGGPAAELAHPTISSLVEPFVASEWGRPVFVVAWVLGGLALLGMARRAGARR